MKLEFVETELQKLSNSDRCVMVMDPIELHLTSNEGVSLQIMHLNIRSFYKNFNSLLMLLEDLTTNRHIPDVIVLCETFLNNITLVGAILNGYKGYHSVRLNQMGGGVSIFVKDDINVTKVTVSYCKSFVEVIGLELLYHNETFHVLEVYRIPNTDPKLFLSELKSLIIQHTADNVLIATDQNLDLLQYNVYPAVNELLELLLSNMFSPMITKPTRITHSTCTLIDNVYVRTKRYKICTSAVICDNMSDHNPCYVNLNIKTDSNNKQSFYSTRSLNEEKISNITTKLLNHRWDSFYELLNVDTAYNYIVKTIQNVLNVVAPVKYRRQSTLKSFTEPWMSVKLSKYNRKCRKLCEKYKRLPNECNKRMYQNYRKTLQKLKRFEKRVFYKNLFEKIATDSKSIGVF